MVKGGVLVDGQLGLVERDHVSARVPALSVELNLRENSQSSQKQQQITNGRVNGNEQIEQYYVHTCMYVRIKGSTYYTLRS